MKGNYKKSFLIINCILLISLIVLLVNLFVIKNYSYWLSIIVLLITFLILFIIYGFERKKRRFTYETMYYIFSYTIIYLMISYIIGIRIGFNTNLYKLNIVNVLKNIIPYFLLIIVSELLRDEIIRKADKSCMGHLLITIILIIIDCTIFLNSFDISTVDGQIKYLFHLVLPSISKNILLLYITKIGGMYPSTMYRLIMDLKMFILPIFPDFGYYFESVLNVCFPAVLGFIINSNLSEFKNEKIEYRNIKNNKLFTYVSILSVSFLVLSVITLSSGKFKYVVISIGSGSMTGTINKGDAVIYEKQNENCIPKLGDILVFRKENKLVVHRIINVIKVKDEMIYYTKGDANDTEDGYPLTKDDVVGVVKKRIKYVGIPSVAINELTHK